MFKFFILLLPPVHNVCNIHKGNIMLQKNLLYKLIMLINENYIIFGVPLKR